ncbi:hypothetical protein GCM10009007_02950 [Formosimonas limnophila]|uniref:Uncharacterized protein n=1 Tax=Formosimonas limnophila TaxID=1384487 RepID=A0A8J3CFR2_9BURK|nr:hypothetical protein [Formosimonas limnophila]GHA65930.1 hypothetical protein GCM10009007_02950 [Formosimonas limnophila]
MNARKAKALRRLAHYKGERPPLEVKYGVTLRPSRKTDAYGNPVSEPVNVPLEARYPKGHPRAYYQYLKKILPKGTPFAAFFAFG